MKRFICAAVFGVAVLGFSGFVSAQEEAAAPEKDYKINGTLTVGYWFGEFNQSMTGATQDSDPGFLPDADLKISFAPNWNMLVKYRDSDKNGISPQTAAMEEEEETLYMFGARYDDVDSGWYGTVGFQKLQSDWSDNTGDSDSTEFHGFRLGGGYDLETPGSPWTLSADIGFGLANDMDYHTGGTGLSADASGYDADVNVKYRVSESRIKLIAGYRYVKYKSDNNVDQGNTVPAISAKLKGPYVALGVDF